MNITIDLSASIATDRESWTLTDSSVFGTGGNPARNAVAVFVSSSKMNFDNSVDEALTVTGSDPETDSSWTITYTKDGWYRTYYVIIPYYSAGTYARYDAVYDSGTGNVYRSKQNSNVETDLTNTTWWELIADPSSLAANKGTSSESLNINSLVYQRVFSADGQYDYANRMSDQCGCADCDDISALEWYNLYAMLLDQIAIADSRSEVLDGEEISRRVQSNFIDCQ